MRERFLERLLENERKNRGNEVSHHPGSGRQLPIPVPTWCADEAPVDLDLIARHKMRTAHTLVVLSNGHFSRAHTVSSLPGSCSLLSLDEAWSSFGSHLNACMERSLHEEQDAYAMLNGAHHGSGLFLYLAPGTILKDPIQILSFLSSEGLIAPRIHILIDEGASATLVEKTVGVGCCVNHVDVHLCKNASLFFFEGTRGVRSLRVFLSEASSFSHLSYSTRTHQTINAVLAGEHGSCTLKGLFDLSRNDVKNRHIENSPTQSKPDPACHCGVNADEEARVAVHVEHRAPHCRSRQHFKFVNGERSRSHFSGTIYVHPAAQKTEGYQLCQNLLLGSNAVATVEPCLKIFADDVKASHGATISQLNAEELFYLQTRGLSEQEAKQLLRKGFCREIRDALPNGFL